MRSTRPQTDRPRRDDIEAGVAAHNAADRAIAAARGCPSAQRHVPPR
jgi:hypothetical protein